MKDIIKKQLEEVKAVELEFTDSTTSLFIPKTFKITQASMSKGGVYIIDLHSNITHPSDDSTLASNWNNGKVPEYDRYIVEVQDNVGKMLKVTGVACDNNTSQFIGWLPYDGFDVLSKFT